MRPNINLKPFFEPRRVAIIGASSTKGKLGRTVVENLIKNKYKGKIFPVNPKSKKILGLKTYPSVKDIPYPVDLAYIIIPASECLNVVKECGEKGIKSVIIASGGFSEADDAYVRIGEQLQDKILQIIRKYGMRLIGPNTSGIVSIPNSFVATFFPLKKVTRGNVSYIAQTGNFASHTLRWILSSENYGISRVVGLGNKCDVNDAEVLRYLADDHTTKVIGIYMEGIKDGRKFIREAQRASKIKPVLILKSGFTESGARTAFSHTASLASDDLIVDFAFRQAGVIRLQNYEDLINVVKAFSFQPIPKGNRVGILAPSGAMGVLISDSCDKRGLKVATPKDETIKRIEEISPRWLKIRNPVDIWGPITHSGVDTAYKVCMETLLSDDAVDALISVLMLIGKFSIKRLHFISKLNKKFADKPILVTVTGDKDLYEKAKRYLEKSQIPVYSPLDEAVKALSAMYEYSVLNPRNNY